MDVDSRDMRGEGKRDRFIRLAEKRVNKALDALRLVGNLSNRGNYEYADADVDKILKALEAELRELKRRFGSLSNNASRAFKL
jgi:hypothetical protein